MFLGKVIRYVLVCLLKVWVYFDNGVLEFDNNIVECVVCLIVVGCKNYFFMGLEVGGKFVVIVYILIEIVKMNYVNFEVWFVWVFECI